MPNVINLICLFFCILLFAGCATKQDMRRVHDEFNQKTTTQAKDLELLKQENSELRKMIESNREAIAALRKTQAEINADMTDLKDRSQQQNGRTEELRKDLTALGTSTQRKNEEIKEKVDRATFKINFIENFLGLGKKDAAAEAAEKGNRSANGQPKDAQNGKADKESTYAGAYDIFKAGNYEKARTEFQNYLKLHPRSEYSGNAQFWIGECYYNEHKYEKAILEYEKVVKNFPDGNKVPAALLKQGLSFQKLGDKTSAQLILQQVIRDYPNTNQARVARAKLLEIK
jgi:tol-pal system protein YbgF